MADAAISNRHLQNILTTNYDRSVMRGWECFGVSDKPERRTLRRIGDLPHKGHKMPSADQCSWPASEVHHGVAHIEVSSHADDVTSSYVYVCGPNKARVEAAWIRVVESVPFSAWWT